MKRDNVQTVTLPVLVRVDIVKEADGWDPFIPTKSGERGLIRVVTADDARKWLRTEFKSAEDNALFVGVSKLKWAYDEGDEFTLRQAFEKLQPYVKGIPSPEVIWVDLPSTKKGMKIALGTGGQDLSIAPGGYSSLMTQILKCTQFVIWYSEKDERLLPALYCPDKKTAVFAMRFTGRILVCPKCDTPFIPIAGNIDYCCIKHRESHRVERFRWRKKQRTEAEKQRRKAQ